MAEKEEDPKEKWAKYARRQLVKSYIYLIFLFFGPMITLYWLGRGIVPLIGCVAAGFLVTFFCGVYILETLPSYGATWLTGGQGKATETLEEFNRKLKRNYLIALPFALFALAVLIWMFLDKQETGRLDPFWLSAFALLVLGIRVFCAPVKKVLIMTGPIIMIFSPFVIIGHLIWTLWVLLSARPYSDDRPNASKPKERKTKCTK